TASDEVEAAQRFARICPGRRVPAPASAPGARAHPILGNHLSAWEGWASNPETRHAGSSGGVLTALASWLVETGRSTSVIGAGADAAPSTRTVPITITTREEALGAAGSR